MEEEGEEEEMEEDQEVEPPKVNRKLKDELDRADDGKRPKDASNRPEPKRRVRRKAPESADPEAAEGQPAEKKPRKARKTKAAAVIPNDVADLKDSVMKGVFLQVMKDAGSLTFDDLKEHLKLKADHLPNDKVCMNTYWTKTSSAVMLLLDPKKPTASSFSYKLGSWNQRMTAAHMSSLLMVA